MHVIPATPTFMGIPTEARQRILDFYFRDLYLCPYIETLVAVNRDGTALKDSRSHISKRRHICSPLFLVSKQLRVEVETIFPLQLHIILREGSARWNQYGIKTPAMPAKYNALKTIPHRWRRFVKQAYIDGMMPFSGHNMYQRLPPLNLASFTGLKTVEIKFYNLFIHPTEPISCQWSVSKTEISIDRVSERVLLNGKPRGELKRALNDALECFDKYSFAFGSVRTFELIFRFDLVYQAFQKTEQMSETTVGRCVLHWNYDRKRFIPNKSGEIFDWSIARSRNYHPGSV